MAACLPFKGVDEGVGWRHGGVVVVGVVAAGGGGQHGQQAKVAVTHRRQQRTTPGDIKGRREGVRGDEDER